MAVLNIGIGQVAKKLGDARGAGGGLDARARPAGGGDFNRDRTTSPTGCTRRSWRCSASWRLSAGTARSSSRKAFSARFHDENVPRSLPHDVELCLFRIVQEGLNNVVKHSGASEAQVTLRVTGDVLVLTVADVGRGFDEAGAAVQDGLGLASMRERLRLIDGEFTVRSAAGSGHDDRRARADRRGRQDAADTVGVGVACVRPTASGYMPRYRPVSERLDNGYLRRDRAAPSCFALKGIPFQGFCVIASVCQSRWKLGRRRSRKARRPDRGRISRVFHRRQTRSSHHEHSEQQSRTRVAGLRNRACGFPGVWLSSVARNRRERFSRRILEFGASARRSRSSDWSHGRGAHRHLSSPPDPRLRSFVVAIARRARAGCPGGVWKRNHQRVDRSVLPLRHRRAGVLRPGLGLADLLARRQHRRAAGHTARLHAAESLWNSVPGSTSPSLLRFSRFSRRHASSSLAICASSRFACTSWPLRFSRSSCGRRSTSALAAPVFQSSSSPPWPRSRPHLASDRSQGTVHSSTRFSWTCSLPCSRCRVWRWRAVIAERERAKSDREQLIREQTAVETRLRLAAIVESSNDAIFSKNLDGIVLSWNAAAERIFGFTEAEVIGQPAAILLPPGLEDEENRLLQRFRAGERIDRYRTIRVTKAGNTVNVSLTITPLSDSAGALVGVAEIVRDITEQDRAEKALSSVSRRLIHAQEQERARIARELHDDIGQRLALLAIELTNSRRPVRRASRKPDDQTAEAGRGDRDRYSGAVARVALLETRIAGHRDGHERLLRRIRQPAARRCSISRPVTCQANCPRTFLCASSGFYRRRSTIRRNTAGSGSSRCSCGEREDEIHLVVSDPGEGFDLEAARAGRGLGLVSMEERLKLVDGDLSIETQPRRGTRIHARAPFRSGSARLDRPAPSRVNG